MKLYTTDGKYIGEYFDLISDYTGIVEYSDGIKAWYVDGWYHRIGGPAVMWPSGHNQWYINRKKVSKEEHDLLYDIMRLKGLL